MKVAELLAEDYDDNEISEADPVMQEALDKVKRDCGPFLEQCGQQLMYRGTRRYNTASDPNSFFVRKAARTNRSPVNTARWVHEIYDDFFDKKFGIKARSNTVFTTGNYGTAMEYGMVYAVFPIGDFRFVWSPTIDDLYIHMTDLEDEEDIRHYLELAKYKDTDLSHAIHSKNEIMVACKEYYMMQVRKSEVKATIKYLFGND